MSAPRCFFFCLVSGLLWAPVSQAHDGTVNISGTIADNTCTVSQDSKNMTVSMGTVGSKSFARTGDGTAYQPFSISLEKCGGAASRVSVTFSGVADSANRDLLALDGGAGYATGMGVGIYDSEKNLIPLNQSGEETTLTASQASVTLNFFARYVASGTTVAAGMANASATFMLTYA